MDSRLAAPEHWPTWSVVGVAWLVCRLPMRWQMAMGRTIGRVAYRLGGRRRQITEINIRLCFPQLSDAEQTELVRRTFMSVGIALMETMYAWLRPVDKLAARLEVNGLAALKSAQAEGRGVLLVGAHFLTLDLGGAFIATVTDIDAIYRRHKNPVIEHLMITGRERLYGQVIERKDVRRFIRRLKESRTVWYAADHDYGRRHSVFAPFFGRPAATIVAPARMARLNNSPVVFFSHFRDEDALTWSLHFRRVDGYPTGDDQADAANLNRVIEAEIRRYPDQYLWLHRRFKTQPEGVESPYSSLFESH